MVYLNTIKTRFNNELMNGKEDSDIYKFITEQSSRYGNLEQMSVGELIRGINREDSGVHKAVKKTLPQIEKLLEKLIPRIEKGGRIFYMGSGTSGRLGVLDASELPPTFGVPDNIVIGIIAGGDTALRKPVEKAEDNPEAGWHDLQKFNVTDSDTVIGIAASGTTPYVTGVLEKAAEKGLLTACITCNPGSPVTRHADISVEVVVGPEFLTGSTRMKAGTAQKMILNIITTTLMIKLGKVMGNKMVNMQLSNDKLIRRGIRMLMEELKLDHAQARELLLRSGSVRLALDEYRKGRGQGPD
jgi:N-acetylmuramic acid 6-phosphate etherase